MRPPIASPPALRKSASVARPATGRARNTSLGRRAQQSWWPFGKSEDPKKGLLVRFDERRDVRWPIDPKTGNATRNFTPALVRKEVETCGLCHARRGGFSEDWVPGRWLSDTHVVSPLAARALSRRRADARRGLQLRLVQAEQDVRGRRHLQRLPRAARRQASRSRRRRLPAMSRARQVCGGVP